MQEKQQISQKLKKYGQGVGLADVGLADQLYENSAQPGNIGDDEQGDDQ